MTAFLLNLVGLLICGIWLGRRLRLPLALSVGVTVLVFEISVIAGAALASAIGALGTPLYQIVTTLCAAAFAGGLWLVTRRDGASVTAGSISAAETSRISPAIPIVGLVLFACVMLFITLNAYPSVEDSLTVKLPKIVFAIEAQTILPTTLSDDPRMYISPVYPALIQLFFIINGQDGHTLLVFGLINWIVSGVAIHRLCRDTGASSFAAWTATALVLLSPMLIVQGTSEGDDIIAATPFLLSLMFFVAWLRENRTIFAVMAGLGLGLSVGIKLLPLFYLTAAPVILVFGAVEFRQQIARWLSDRLGGAASIIAAFVVALIPNLVTNFIAFGNPFYVSSAVAATRNSPFNLDCALRDSFGYLKQFVFSDLIRLVARAASILSPSATRYENYKAVVEGSSDFLARALPYDPTVACSAYAQAFHLVRHYITDNTLWFGIFGPLVLAAVAAAIFLPRVSFLIRALAVLFMAWALAFSFSQKYIGEIGRYWSMAVLASTPVAAFAIDCLMRRAPRWPTRAVLVGLVAVPTVLLGAIVLAGNAHRSVPQAFKPSRYVESFPPTLRTIMRDAQAVNIQAAYGIDTYDYYILRGRAERFYNKTGIISDAVNVVIVRPSGLTDNPYSDPRIPVKMQKEFANGFRYVGKVRPQPGYDFNLGFANNIATRDGGDAAGGPYLIFEAQGVRIEGGAIVGSLVAIAAPAIIQNLRYRVGWQGPDGKTGASGDWQRAPSAPFSIPKEATALTLDCALEGEDNTGTAEWPIRGFAPDIAERLS